ncbi:hypothetical protein [Butyrivibrio sp. AC2005]|uniref:hypothetical protein n=1 Tax=Butyrivibrio sp. AC2005 TaxID=1280672 RepID=UPI00041B2987|nr:hypothetical protein [Butyrivibrio sp. AC2005]
MTASKVSNYPKLMQTLTSEQKLIYLCGAGASMSLAEHRLSWPSWILAGKSYQTISEQDELDKLIGTWSADDLIDAVTYLLEKLKTTGSYEDYMNKTVGSLHPVNKSFIEALRKIWRAGDLITTTNYDLTIEEAVNCSAVSYSFPAEILSIIRGDSENKVIHLHGVYDRLNNIDDIVADDPHI